MARITLNEINDTMEEVPSKLILVINAIDKGNAELTITNTNRRSTNK